MDCTTGPLESMHMKKWVQCAHVPPFSALSSICLFLFFPLFTKVLLATLLHPFLLLQLFRTCVLGHPRVLIFTYGYTHRHAVTLSRTA